MIKISHVINPFICSPDNPNYLYYAQPITFKSMLNAKKYALNKNIKVTLYSANFKEDDSIVPNFFVKLPHLTKSTMSLYPNISNGKKVPFIQDIINKLYKSSNDNYFIYTNIDIGVQKNFYVKIANIIKNNKYDSFIINRRDNIPKFKNGLRLKKNNLNIIYKEKGINHPGRDCFIFKRDLVPKINLKDLFIGFPPWGKIFYLLLKNISNKFNLYKNLYLTFHIGKDKAWVNKKNKKNQLIKKNIENSKLIKIKNIENSQLVKTKNIENSQLVKTKNSKIKNIKIKNIKIKNIKIKNIKIKIFK